MLNWINSLKSTEKQSDRQQIQERICIKWQLRRGLVLVKAASPNLRWIAEQQECLHGSPRQIMSITYCVENSSPLFSFNPPPQQKTNGPHSLLFGWGVNYRPPGPYEQQLQTITLSGSRQEPSLPGFLCWYHLLHAGLLTPKPDLCMKHN